MAIDVVDAIRRELRDVHSGTINVIGINRHELQRRNVIQRRCVVHSTNLNGHSRFARSAITIGNGVIERVVTNLTRIESLDFFCVRWVVVEAAIAVDGHFGTKFTQFVIADDRQRIIRAGGIAVVAEQPVAGQHIVLINLRDPIVSRCPSEADEIVDRCRSQIRHVDRLAGRRGVTGGIGLCDGHHEGAIICGHEVYGGRIELTHRHIAASHFVISRNDLRQIARAETDRDQRILFAGGRGIGERNHRPGAVADDRELTRSGVEVTRRILSSPGSHGDGHGTIFIRRNVEREGHSVAAEIAGLAVRDQEIVVADRFAERDRYGDRVRVVWAAQ